jgi:lysozyme family protein
MSNVITPRQVMARIIDKWEGGYQSYVDDLGNWINGRLVGTMRGVTPAALAAHRGISGDSITPEMMQSVTLDEAADIGVKHYYEEPGFNKLRWTAATASIADFGWGSGPVQAAISMQRIVGVSADGVVGPMTVAAYNAWEDRTPDIDALKIIHDMREAFYRMIVAGNPKYEKFLGGWINRDDWVSAATTEWFGLFQSA